VVIDETGGLSPGPLTGFDVAFRRRLTVVRALSPAERDHPFTVFDPIVSFRSAVGEAVKDAHGGRVFLVAAELPQTSFSDGYQLRTVRRYLGIERTLVGVYSRSAARAP
jgi:hypothetical protein